MKINANESNNAFAKAATGGPGGKAAAKSWRKPAKNESVAKHNIAERNGVKK